MVLTTIKLTSRDNKQHATEPNRSRGYKSQPQCPHSYRAHLLCIFQLIHLVPKSKGKQIWALKAPHNMATYAAVVAAALAPPAPAPRQPIYAAVIGNRPTEKPSKATGVGFAKVLRKSPETCVFGPK
jgi:hypothetical protein